MWYIQVDRLVQRPGLTVAICDWSSIVAADLSGLPLHDLYHCAAYGTTIL